MRCIAIIKTAKRSLDENKKLKSHKGVIVKALLDNGAIGLFMNIVFAKKRCSG